MTQLRLQPRPEDRVRRLFSRLPEDQRLNVAKQLAYGALPGTSPGNLAIRSTQDPYRLSTLPAPTSRSPGVSVPGITPGTRFASMPTSGDIAKMAEARRAKEQARILQMAAGTLGIPAQMKHSSPEDEGLAGIFGLVAPSGGGGGGGGNNFFEKLFRF